MTYRDDRDALHEEVDKLREERDAALRRAAEADDGGDRARQLRRIEAEIAAYQGHLAALRERVRALQPARSPSSRAPLPIVAAAGAALLAIGVGAGLWLAHRPPPDPAAPEVSAPPPPRALVAPETPTPPTPPSPPPPPPAPVERAEAAEPPVTQEPAAPSARDEFPPYVQWKATVRTARGVPVAPGAKCTVGAQFKPGNATTRGVTSLAIICGKTTLFDTSDPPQGLTLLGGESSPTPGGYSLVYRYVASEGQTYIDTAKQEATVTRQGRREFRVELKVDSMGKPPGAPPP